MGVKVATGCLNWSQPSISRSSSSSTLTSAISSPKRRSFTFTDVSLAFGQKLNRSRSCETLKLSRNQKSIRRIVSSATFDSQHSDDEFSLRFQLFDENDTESSENDIVSETEPHDSNYSDEIAGEITNWFGDLIPASIERKANSVDLPFSLRIVQKKLQLEKGFIEAGEFAYCSMKKAFSSMVFIIRELQSYTLQMREILFFEDLQEILIRVHKEMNASFVWLFQQVFSHTPNLMVCVMILLANYSVYSMSNVISPAPVTPVPVVESVSTVVDQRNMKLDSVNSGGKTSSIGGSNGGGGGIFRPVSSGTEGDGEVYEEEEWGLWETVVEEAEEMIGDGGVDREMMSGFVSPVRVRMEEEEEVVESVDYLKTDVYYQTGLTKEPENPLLLANYAQFLYLFSKDHQRAEEYFKKASETEPKDAETLCKYASFLWHAKNDLWGAEENFLEAIAADPHNSFYSGTYANFLWSNGANDTCFPL